MTSRNFQEQQEEAEFVLAEEAGMVMNHHTTINKKIRITRSEEYAFFLSIDTI